MSLIDSILNLACLLLWVNWRVAKTESFQHAPALTLAGNLKRVGTSGNRWKFISLLLAILSCRAVIYWQIGSVLKLPLGVTVLAFRSIEFIGTLLFSFLSFGHALGIFYLCLLFLALLPANPAEINPVQRWARLQLGRIDRLPWLLRASVPLVVCVALWLSLSPLLAYLQVIPRGQPFSHRIEQSVLIGIAAYLVWKYLIGGLLLLHLISSYVYLGNHPAWNFVNITSRKLLRPLAFIPLRVAKIDFAPVVGIVIVFGIAGAISRLVSNLFPF